MNIRQLKEFFMECFGTLGNIYSAPERANNKLI
jgi:hypothetical protein